MRKVTPSRLRISAMAAAAFMSDLLVEKFASGDGAPAPRRLAQLVRRFGSHPELTSVREREKGRHLEATVPSADLGELPSCPRKSIDSRRRAGRGAPPRNRGFCALPEANTSSRGSLRVPDAGCDSACSAQGPAAPPGALSTSFWARTRVVALAMEAMSRYLEKDQW